MNMHDLATVSQTRAGFKDGTLRKRRIHVELRQREVAEAIGVDPGTYSRWERGQTTPLREHALRLAELFAELESA